MGIRARLLFAFTPLLALVLAAIGALPLLQGEAEATIRHQSEAAADLAAAQQLELAIMRQHDAAGAIARGARGEANAIFRDARAAIEAALAEEAERDDPSRRLDMQISDFYRRLALMHEGALALAAGGDIVGASALFDRPQMAKAVDAVLILSQQVREVNQRRLDEVNAAALAAQQRTFSLIALALAAGAILAFGLTWLLMLQIARPLDALAADGERYAAGDLAGRLSAVGSISQLRRLRDSFQNLIDANAARQGRLQAALGELEERVAREERLRETVQALSLPVVPLAADTLLLPIVGHLDDRRADELTRSLLDAIQQRRARAAVLDITGMAELTPEVAAGLRRTVEAARLLGCQVTLVGVRADQALALSASDLQASGVAIARDIPSLLGRAGAAKP